MFFATHEIGKVMDAKDLSAAIRDVLAEHGRLAADPSNVNDDADLYALGLASHATVNVVLALEDTLDIEIPDELLVKSTFSSIASIRDALSDLVSM